MSSTKTHKKSKSRKKLVHLEPLFRGVRQALIHDLGSEVIDPEIYKEPRGNIPSISLGANPYSYKKYVQIMDFDKRVIWSADTDFEMLGILALYEFSESQSSFGPKLPLSRTASAVVLRASQICHEILGEFDVDRWLDFCVFGKKGAVGLKSREAYLDNRFERLNGTLTQVQWFNHCLARDIHLLRAVRKRCRRRKIVYAVNVSPVPKTFKSARTVAPDTTIGGFLSRGLGLYVECLIDEGPYHVPLRVSPEEVGIFPLRKRQEAHRKMAQTASKTGGSGTLDMKKASDSFVEWHVQMLMPESWHSAMAACRTPLYKTKKITGDRYHELKSYMLMGSGHTFPIQTLLFYCLAKAVCDLMKIRGPVSVFGDDIIMPTRACVPFMSIMHDLGFIVNRTKSFYDELDPLLPSRTLFRESCGGDYKGGIDVRPLMPECDLQRTPKVPRNEFCAWCHKLINGLLDRWSPFEVEFTLRYLLQELHNQNVEICFVPSWETEHSGIVHYLPPIFTLGMRVRHVVYRRQQPCYLRLSYRMPKRPRRIEERPYYWLKLYLGQDLPEPDPVYSKPISLTGEDRKWGGVYNWVIKEQIDHPKVRHKCGHNKITE